MPGSILVARVLGIDIRIHLSWFLIFALILFTLADQVLPELRPNWSDQKTVIVAAVTALLFFISVLAHELSHAVVARRFKMDVSSITLFLLGGVANLRKEPPSAKAEFLMAGAGPLMSFVIGIIGLGISFIVTDRLAFSPALDPVGVVASYLGIINISLGVFNLIPGFPLDGGRVLRSIVWGIRKDRHVATRIAARGGQVVAGLLFLVGVYRAIELHDTFGGVWSGMIAYFLYNAASSSIQQERMTEALSGATVRSLLHGEPPTASSGMTVGRLVREVMLPNALRAVPIMRGDRLVGLVTVADLHKIDQTKWEWTSVDEAMTGIDQLAMVAPDDTLVSTLERFQTSPTPVLLVLEGSRLVGILDREAIVGYLRMRESLGLR
ncbi:MAG: site-2 protease family protein [Chloroflexi bacterium]|nr:site-2 protease family protein [Chloroflexota bacterium]